MPLKTTVVGAFPKPDYLQTPDWFRYGAEKKNIDGMCYNIDAYTHFKMSDEQLANTNKAISEVLSLQEQLGIDVVSDGEMKRENYVHYFCRHLQGMDFENGVTSIHRNGATVMKTPAVRGQLMPKDPSPWCIVDWAESQKLTSLPLKYTIPGPMTIADSTINEFYKDHKEELCDLRDCIVREVQALAAAGCKHIQIDEPLLVRKPEIALNYGIDILADCFKGLDEGVEKIVHLCCGYPTYLDQDDYPKADRSCYLQLADKLDRAGFDAVSIEDTHCYNDLAFLDKFKKSKIIFGSVAIAKSAVESQKMIEARLREARKHLPAERLIVAPDCGLGFLPTDIMMQKLTNMIAAAKAIS